MTNSSEIFLSTLFNLAPFTSYSLLFSTHISRVINFILQTSGGDRFLFLLSFLSPSTFPRTLNSSGSLLDRRFLAQMLFFHYENKYICKFYIWQYHLRLMP